MDWRGLILVAVLGICIGLVSGFVENPPEASIIGHKYYGHPLVWRIVRALLDISIMVIRLFGELPGCFLVKSICILSCLLIA